MRKKVAVLKFLSEFIRTGRLQNGDRLPSERSLAEEFHVGRNTLREAIYSLEAQGIVEVKPGSGCFLVARELLPPEGADNIAPDADIEVFEILFQMFSCIAAWCGTVHGRDLVPRLEQATSMMGAAFLNHETETIGPRYKAYLKFLGHWTGNSVSERMVDVLCAESEIVFKGLSGLGSEQLDNVFADMARLVQAAREGDPEKARKMAGQQICRLSLFCLGREKTMSSPVLCKAVEELGMVPSPEDPAS